MSYSLHTDKTWDETMRDLRLCFEKWGIDEWTAYAVKDSTRGAVTVRYTHSGGKPVMLTYDSQWTKRLNLRALYLCIEDMRMLEVRGLAETMQAAYLQLAAPEESRDPYEVLGVRPEAPIEDIEDMYRIRAKRVHPDTNPDDPDAATKTAELNAAIERIRTERGEAVTA